MTLRNAHRPQRQRGAALLESLIAFVLLAASTVGIVRLEGQMRLHADLARQRSEAVRFGVQEVELLRAIAADGTASASQGWAGMADAERWIDASSGHDSNTDYRVDRRIDAAALRGAKPASITVEWQGRDGAAHRLSLDSVIAPGATAYSGALGLGAGTGSPRGAFARAPSIPLGALPIGQGRSAWKPAAAATTAYVFDDKSGRIVGRCTGIAAATMTRSLTTADLTSCTVEQSLLLSGTIRFSSAGPASATDAQDMPLTTQVMVALSGGSYPSPPECHAEAIKTVRYAYAGSLHIDAVPITALPGSLGLASWDETGDQYIAYGCVVTPRADGRWSGRALLVASGWAIGTDAHSGEHRVCRYVAQRGGGGAVDANIGHPAEYRDVAVALMAQNFLVVDAGAACPAASSAGLHAQATEQHQP